MAYTGLVPVGKEDEDFRDNHTEQQPATATRNKGQAPVITETTSSSISLQRVSTAAQKLIDSAIRNTTKMKYRSIERAWLRHCQEKDVDPMQQDTSEFLNFLAAGYERRLMWATLRGYVAALSKYMKHVDILQVRRLLKGVFNLRPPVAKYTVMWGRKRCVELHGGHGGFVGKGHGYEACDNADDIVRK